MEHLASGQHEAFGPRQWVPDSMFPQVLLSTHIAEVPHLQSSSSEGRGLVWGLAKADTKWLVSSAPGLSMPILQVF